jgi:hypothetical protein
MPTALSRIIGIFGESINNKVRLRAESTEMVDDQVVHI